jgi:Skp family chaperone for outer membrane proteins
MLGIFVLSVCGGAAYSAEKSSAAPTIAMVNVEMVFSQSDLKKKLDADLQIFGTQLTQKFDLMKNNMLLTPDELGQLTELTAKPNPTADDTTKIHTLTQTETQREQELTSLQQKQGATDADKARIKVLTDQGAKAVEALKAEKDADEQKFQVRQVDLSRQVMAQIEATVAVVAKSKGYSIVLNKAFGSATFVVYSSNDITDDVLQKLNKK